MTIRQSEPEGNRALEISDYLRIIRRRLWILILVPLLAGGAVAALQLRQPTTYAATATVAAPALVGGSQNNQYTGASGAKAFVSNFTAAITAPVIVNRVATETDVLPGNIVSGLSVTPIGDSSLLQVTYKTHNRGKAEPVAKAAASDTIKFLFETQVALAQRTLTEAQKGVTAADTALAGFVRTNGPLPEVTFNTLANQISTLQVQQANQTAAANYAAAASLGAQVRTAQAKLAQIAPAVTTFRTLTDRKTQADARFGTAQIALDQANAQAAAADPASVISLNKTKPVSRLAPLLKTVLPAAGAGLFLAVGIVFLLEVLGRRPRRTRPLPAAAAGERIPTRR